MLAVAWPWADAARDRNSRLSERLGASLCSGIGGQPGTAEAGGLHLAYRPLRSTPALSRAWRPAILPSGRVVAFHGYFDNAAAIATELGVSPDDLGQLYGLAVERWGDEAERRIIGEYCAVIAEPDRFRLRLSRSPLRAPPLFYFHDEQSPRPPPCPARCSPPGSNGGSTRPGSRTARWSISATRNRAGSKMSSECRWARPWSSSGASRQSSPMLRPVRSARRAPRQRR